MQKYFLSKSLKLALPMISGRIFFVLTTFIGILMVAQLGHTVLAASTFVSAVYSVISVVAMGILFSISPIVSQANGKKEYILIGSVIQQAWLLGIIISIPAMWVMWHISDWLILLGQNKALCFLARGYFHHAVFGVPAMLMMVVSNQFVSGIFKQMVGFWFIFLSFCTMTIFNYLFIFGKLGLPAFGMSGLGIAYSINYWLWICILLIFFAVHPHYQRFELFRFRLLKNFDKLKMMFQIGWPISIHVSTELIAVFVRVLFIGWLGVIALAANQIVSQYDYLMIIPIYAISQSSGILIGHSIGAKNDEHIKYFAYWNVLLGVLYVFIMIIICALFGTHLIKIFITGQGILVERIAHLAWVVLFILLAGELFDAVRNVLTGSLRGMFDTRMPMLISVLGLWVIGIPLGYLFAFLFHGGLIGLVMSTNVGILAGAILIFMRWKKLLAAQTINHLMKNS